MAKRIKRNSCYSRIRAWIDRIEDNSKVVVEFEDETKVILPLKFFPNNVGDGEELEFLILKVDEEK